MTATRKKYGLKVILLGTLVSVAPVVRVSTEDLVADAYRCQLSLSVEPMPRVGCVRERERERSQRGREREGVLCGNETCLLFQLQAILFRGSNPGLDDLHCYPLMTASA